MNHISNLITEFYSKKAINDLTTAAIIIPKVLILINETRLNLVKNRLSSKMAESLKKKHIKIYVVRYMETKIN